MDKDGPYQGQYGTAPEVVESPGADGMIPVHKPQSDMESPQVVHQQQYNPFFNPQQQHNSPPDYASQNGYSGYGSSEEKGFAGGGAAATAPKASKPASSLKRKRWIWVVIGAVLLALAIGLGVGLGVGLSQSSNKNNVVSHDQSDGDSQSANGSPSATSTTSGSTTASTTSSATASAVTSGTTGLAAFSCNSTETTASPEGVNYIQECYTQFQVGHPSYYSVDDNVTMANLGGKLTVYTFEACLNQCDEWNSDGNTPPCRAVTYYANLSTPIQMWGGNCFLKNDRGNGYQTDPIDWSHTASAWQSCLNETCWGENA